MGAFPDGMGKTKAEEPITLLDTISVLETRRDQLFSFLAIPGEEKGEMLSTTVIVDAKNRILQVNSDLNNVLETLEKRRAQLQAEFGEPLF